MLAVKAQASRGTKPAVYTRAAYVPGRYRYHLAHFMLLIGKASHGNGLVVHPTAVPGAVTHAESQNAPQNEASFVSTNILEYAKTLQPKRRYCLCPLFLQEGSKLQALEDVIQVLINY